MMKNNGLKNTFTIKSLGCYVILFSFSFVSFAQEYVDGRLVSSKKYDKNVCANSVIDLYQKNLSELKNGRCAMYPSCSNYGLMVFNEKPFFVATSLLGDRLVRCSHDKTFYNTTYAYGYCSFIDYPYYKKNPSCLTETPDVYTDIVKSSKDSVILFVNHLINNQEYNSALLEIQRREFFDKSNPTIASKKLLCYRALDRLEDGIYEYETLLPKSLMNDGLVMYQAARLYYNVGNFERAISILNRGLDIGAYSCESLEKVYILKAMSYVRMAEFERSVVEFGKLSYFNDSNNTASIDVVERLRNTKYKKPIVAKLLSVIPGGGYLYTKHKGSAVTSFLINSLLMYSTYTCIKSENYGLAGIMGFMSLSFYIGNINGAGRSATRYNDSTRDKYLMELEKINNIINN